MACNPSYLSRTFLALDDARASPELVEGLTIGNILPDHLKKVNSSGKIMPMIRLESFLASLERGNISHAYLLVGGGMGEIEEVAQRISKELAISPFDRQLIGDLGPSEEKVSIATIRGLRARLAMKPHSSSHHFVFFPRADALTPEAQNALLKVLEEPVAPTIFLLATPDERLLLPTVVSRCRRVQLAAHGASVAVPDELAAISRVPLADQFALAERLAKDADLLSLLDAWALALRQRLVKGEAGMAPMMQQILKAKEMMRDSQVNRRLVMEDLFLSLPNKD